MALKITIKPTECKKYIIFNVLEKAYPKMKTTLSFKLVVVSLLALASSPALAAKSHQASVIAQVKQTAEQEKLIASPACTDYLYTANAEQGMDRVNVMEKHGGHCGGDPQIQHRLFSVYVDQQTHQMLSDVADPTDGTLSLLSPP